MQRRKKNSPSSSKGKVNKKIVVEESAEEKSKKRWQKWMTRFWSTWLMIGGFGLIIYGGHIPLIIFIIVIQIWSFLEIMAIRSKQYETKKKKNENEDLIPVHKVLDTWFFTITLYAINANIFFTKYPKFFLTNNILKFAMINHRGICFSLFIIGFLAFVMTLRRGKLKQQIKNLSWTIITMLLVGYAGSFHVVNILNGLFWFLMPCLLVICNDIWAFVWGFQFGKKFCRTTLINLSPNKSWEGFIGGGFSTVIFAFIFAYLMAQPDFLICPKDQLTLSPFNNQCERNPVFELHTYQIPKEISSAIQSSFGHTIETIDLYPVQFDAIVLAIIASLIAPFGGFMASGFKRAFNLDDFGDSIPGHGGITDRMDCQFVMGGCAMFYYSTFVNLVPIGLEAVRKGILQLDTDQKQIIFDELKEMLQ